jgi:hypothetical protein
MKKLSINQFLTSKVSSLDQNQMRHILGGKEDTTWKTVNKSGSTTGSGTDVIRDSGKTEYSNGDTKDDDSNLILG